jgi:hypothetical protein
LSAAVPRNERLGQPGNGMLDVAAIGLGRSPSFGQGPRPG